MSIFRSTTPQKIAAEQLCDARLALLEHEAAAEFNDAMARMLRDRIARLSPVAAPESQPSIYDKYNQHAKETK